MEVHVKPNINKPIMLIVLSSVMFLLLVASCAGNVAVPQDEFPQSQDTDPVEEPYPAPDQVKPPQDVEATAFVEPYPEPEQPELIEPGLIADHEYAPQSGDDKMTRGNVLVEESGIQLLESYPVQVKLQLVGNLPTPCHELRAVVLLSKDGERIDVELYSLSDPDQLCTQVLEPFSASIPLGNYTEGSYTVWVNEKIVGEFELP
jgi:hypothetical protein